MRLKPTTAFSLAFVASLGLAQGAAAKTYKITYIMGLTGNPFYSTVACGGHDQARRTGNVTFDAQGPAQYQPAMQMKVLDAVIASRPDGIMFTADDPVALTSTLLQAKAMGIKIISIDGDIKNMSVAIANIQSDNFLGGKQAAIELAKAIGDKGKVMALMNSPAANVAQQRLKGFTDEMKLHPGIQYIGVQYSNNQTAKAAGIVTATIAANPDLAGIFTITTNNTEGAATGVREAGLVGKVKIVGFDTSDPIVEDIRQGIVTADVVQYPFHVGQLGVEMMVQALEGKAVEREVHTPFVIATKANIDTPEVQKFVYKMNCQ
ncbi:MAG: substrate-binding domain-containing protein [Rhodospirillales bacterium]|nr:substrate-binding domain-containing protein [Rhodospirillales bacterium]